MKKNGLNVHFPTYVYYAYDILTKEEHDCVLAECDVLRKSHMIPADKKGWFCNVETSFFHESLTENQKFHPLIRAISEHIKYFCFDFLRAEIRHIQSEKAWINVSAKGQYQEIHTHPNSSISAIYYLKAPKGSGKTIFKNPYEKQITLPIKEKTNITYQAIEYKPEEGKLLLFESHVPHLVQQHEIDEERMTFSANFRVW